MHDIESWKRFYFVLQLYFSITYERELFKEFVFEIRSVSIFFLTCYQLLICHIKSVTIHFSFSLMESCSAEIQDLRWQVSIGWQPCEGGPSTWSPLIGIRHSDFSTFHLFSLFVGVRIQTKSAPILWQIRLNPLRESRSNV